MDRNSGNLLFKLRALNETTDNKVGCCGLWETQLSDSCSAAATEEHRNSHSEARCSTGTNEPAWGFNVDGLVAETTEFAAPDAASIGRPMADVGGDSCLGAERMARC
jgi:hypothetical protein